MFTPQDIQQIGYYGSKDNIQQELRCGHFSFASDKTYLGLPLVDALQKITINYVFVIVTLLNLIFLSISLHCKDDRGLRTKKALKCTVANGQC